jgi:hypothetical protein
MLLSYAPAPRPQKLNQPRWGTLVLLQQLKQTAATIEVAAVSSFNVYPAIILVRYQSG